MEIPRLKYAVLVAPLLFAMAGGALATRDFYVATNGNDRNLGTRAKPFATLERARDAIRQLKKSGRLPKGGVTVWIRGGIYHFWKTFELTPADSGTEEARVTYTAYRGETVRLNGGRGVTGFKSVRDLKLLRRLDRDARPKIVQVNLKAQGITDFGKMTSRGFGRPIGPAGLELFFQDKPMQLARWPNEGWERIAGVPSGKDGGKFTYSGDRPKRWADSDDLWVHGYWTWDWADSYEKVREIDTAKREIITEPPHGVYGYSAGKRFYALNILEELDWPGEWYLDRKTGILYFWPPAPLNSGRVHVSILEDAMVSLKDVSYVTFRDLTFEVTQGNAIDIFGGEHNLVAGCTLRNIGNLAVSLNGGKENGVFGCHIYETGDGAVRLSAGDRRTLSPGGHFVVNNHIHDFSRWSRTYRPAVLIRGVGSRIANNLIHDAPHTAILLGGNEHLIEFNEIHRVCMETSDAGAFYMGRDFTMRGNIVRYNFIHQLGEGSVQGIYLDDCASGTLVYGNICYKAGRGVLLGGGRDNTIENNIFVECKPAIHVDGRGMGWASFWFDGRDSTLMDRLKAMNHTQPPYSERYPELVKLLDDDPAIPKGNKILRNIRVGGRWLDLLNGLTGKIIKIRDNFTEGDPKFVAPEKLNFQLRPDSPAFKVGFKRIPILEIGLFKSVSPDSVREKP